MLTAVDFISQATFGALKPAPDMAAVSIGDPAQYPPANLAAFRASLRLEFLDLELDELGDYPEEALCSASQMQELVAFVCSLHATTAPVRLIVHCRMGSSRSAAVALVVHQLTGCNFPRHADAHFANRHVTALAEAALGTTIEIPSILQQEGEPHPYLPQALQI